MKKLISIGMIFVSMLQAMDNEKYEPPYKSSPVMSIRGRVREKTDGSITDLLTTVNGYCTRSGIGDDEKEIVTRNLKQMILKKYTSLEGQKLSKIEVQLNKEQDEVPKGALCEEYVVGLLDQITIMKLEEFLEEYYAREGVNERHRKKIKKFLTNKLFERRRSQAEYEFGNVLVYLVDRRRERRLNGVNKSDLIKTIGEYREVIRFKEERSSGSDSRLSTLGRISPPLFIQNRNKFGDL